MHKKGFTIAEILITLMVIGIVSAIIIPSVIGKYRENMHVTRLVKVYNTLQNAYMLAVFNNEELVTGSFKNGGTQIARSQLMADTYSKYINNLKICGKDINKGCFTENRYRLLTGKDDTSGLTDNHNGYIDSDATIIKSQWADGVSFYFKSYGTSCNNTSGKQDGVSYAVCGWIGVDTNGPLPPNQYGIDFFEFQFAEPPLGIIPGGKQGQTWSNQDVMTQHCNLKSSSPYNGRYCTAWVLENRNMDYLRCKGLTWTNKKCQK